jgi:hypothetical protein
MNLDNHAFLIGRLVCNLHSLEFVVRAYLYANRSQPHTDLEYGKNLNTLTLGDEVPINAMTDYSTLGQLIDRYNDLVKTTHPDLQIDRSVIDIRDAIAHGRVSSDRPDADLVLLKFEKPVENITTVSFREDLSPEWLSIQVGKVLTELRKVGKAPGTPFLHQF